MRQLIFGLIAAAAVVAAGATPASACGWGGCCGWISPCAQGEYVPTTTYYVPTTAYIGCGGCGWGYQHLAEPTTQYYYVNQGPTYSGPGAFAPLPAYEENAIPYYRHRYYGGAGYRWHHHYYHYAHRHYGYPLRRYY